MLERERERPMKSVTAEICKEIAKALTEWWAWIEAQTPRGRGGVGTPPSTADIQGRQCHAPLSASNSGDFKRKLRLTKVQKWRENCRNKNEKEIRNCIPRNSIKDMENLRNSWKILNTTSELANSSTESKSSSIFNWGKDSIETIPACLLWPHKRFTARFFQLVLLIFDFGAEIRINNIIIVVHTHEIPICVCGQERWQQQQQKKRSLTSGQHFVAVCRLFLMWTLLRGNNDEGRKKRITKKKR